MYMCVDCKSHNIIETDDYYCYFREGDYLKLRTVAVYKNMNDKDKKHGWFAMCPEISLTSVVLDETPLSAIIKLGELLNDIYHVQLIGKEIDTEHKSYY